MSLAHRLWLGSGNGGQAPPAGLVDAELPRVCVQLPLFDEPEHAEAVVDAAARLDWPDAALEVQILDDSTDATSDLVRRAIRRARARRPRLTLRHMRRAERRGYKAGAMNAGVAATTADLVAIFDCDFRPEPAFLRRLVPRLLADERAAAVQAAWGFGAPSSLLARAQEMLLNCHFHLEHAGRHRRGLTLNFNGTAGIWRRRALDELGGWSHQSVTEDLHLSLKAQLAGWRILYDDGVVCASELPPCLASFLIQQRRWAKGNGQVLRLLGREVMAHRAWSLRRRLDCLWHLAGYGVATWIVVACVLLPFWLAALATWAPVAIGLGACVLASFAAVFAGRRAHWGRSTGFVGRLGLAGALLLAGPLLVALIAPAFWRGLLLPPGRAREMVFERTPKRAAVGLARKDRIVCAAAWALFAFCAYDAIQLDMMGLAVIMMAQIVVSACVVRPAAVAAVVAAALVAPDALAGGLVREAGTHYVKLSQVATSSRRFDTGKLGDTGEDRLVVDQKERQWALYGEAGMPLPWPAQLSFALARKSIERRGDGRTLTSTSLADADLMLRSRLLASSGGAFQLAAVAGLKLPTTPKRYAEGHEDRRYSEAPEDKTFLVSAVDTGVTRLVYGVGMTQALGPVWLDLDQTVATSVIAGLGLVESSASLGVGLPFSSWIQAGVKQQRKAAPPSMFGPLEAVETNVEENVGVGLTLFSGFAVEASAARCRTTIPGWNEWRSFTMGVSHRSL